MLVRLPVWGGGEPDGWGEGGSFGTASAESKYAWVHPILGSKPDEGHLMRISRISMAVGGYGEGKSVWQGGNVLGDTLSRDTVGRISTGLKK